MIIFSAIYMGQSFRGNQMTESLSGQSLLSLHMTKSYVRTATRTLLKVEANLTQILNFKANFHTEFEPFFKKKIMLTMVDTLIFM